ncbi:MAG: response regulator transcription factor [Bacteroidetes bacterium]|nr:response regulator transcription factor [Bacteroidota bacterium]
MDSISVAVVDDHKLFREGLIAIVDSFPGIDVIYEAANGNEIIRKINSQKPDVILMDLQMPELDGIEATKIIKKKRPEIKIIIISMFDEDKYIQYMLEQEVDGYLFKNADSSEVERAIHDVMEKDFYINARVAEVMRKRVIAKGASKPKLILGPDFSNQEINIINLTCSGLTSREISEQLFISYRTVEGHRQRIMSKLGVNNMIALVVYALQNGIVELDEL